METSQQPENRRSIFRKATVNQRVVAAVIVLVAACFFGFIWLVAEDKISVMWLTGPCGFKQSYGLPCPTCGVTTAAVAFLRGKIFEAFYIQPAGAILCCIMGGAGFLALLTAVFGVYFRFLGRFFAEVKARYIILAMIIIVAGGWAVTLARALAARNQG